MTVVTLEEAKARMEELAQLAGRGEEVQISQGEELVLELKRLHRHHGERVFGAWAGRIDIHDDFDDPMPEEWLDLFYSGPVLPEEGEAANAQASGGGT